MEKITLNYPVVLAHGIVAHDRKTFFDFWGRIPQTLTSMGIPVFFGNTDAWGSYESNALMLKATIEKIVLETNLEKVNIIAHSKGGLDSRYLIWKHDFGGKIASLTTICTPHRGSEMANSMYSKKWIHTKLGRKFLDVFGKVYGDINPDIYTLIYQLTTAYMQEFNEKVINDDRVYYQSFYTTMKNAFNDILFSRSYVSIKKKAGANDGAVSEYSAQWGDNVTKIDGGISHADILDRRKRKRSGINVPDLYVEIVKGLSSRGL